MSELLRLSDGDAVSCQGSMKAEIYKPDNGEPRLSLSLVADQVLALRQPPRKREKDSTDAPRRSADRNDRSSARRASGRVSPYAPHGAHPTDSELNDDIPF